MTSSLPLEGTSAPSSGDETDPLARLRALAHGFAVTSRSTSTRASYASAWRSFEAWTKENGLTSLPCLPDTMALYIAHLADLGRKTGTIAGAVVAISQRHRDEGMVSPRESALVRRILRGVQRSAPNDQTPKAPVSREDVTRMIATLGSGLRGARDAAILAVGFGAAMRRSEVVALDVENLSRVPEGLIVTVRTSKTGAGRRVCIPLGLDPSSCALALTRRWLEMSGVTQGPVFRGVTKGGRVRGTRMNARGVARVVKAATLATGLDASAYSAHSLRAGAATTAAREGVQDLAIARKLGHRTLAMTARYIRETRVD